MKLWMFEAWFADQEDQHEFAKNYAILEGSFTNPEAAKKMLKADNPDFESDDESYEKVSQEMLAESKAKLKKDSLLKRRRKLAGINNG